MTVAIELKRELLKGVLKGIAIGLALSVATVIFISIYYAAPRLQEFYGDNHTKEVIEETADSTYTPEKNVDSPADRILYKGTIIVGAIVLVTSMVMIAVGFLTENSQLMRTGILAFTGMLVSMVLLISLTHPDNPPSTIAQQTMQEVKNNPQGGTDGKDEADTHYDNR